jgi:hypothetical protein
LVAAHLLDDAPLNQSPNQNLDVMIGDTDVLGDPLVGSKTAIWPPADIPGEQGFGWTEGPF